MRLWLATILFIALAIAFNPSSSAQSQMFSMPMHGNWCGPGNSGGSWRGPMPPVDPLDYACMQHDMCVDRRGRGDCGCDLMLLQQLSNISYPSGELAAKGRAMHDMLAMIPCRQPWGAAVKQSLFWNELIVDMVSGRSSPMEMPFRFAYLGMRTMENKFRQQLFP